jgi:hypothetical protein
MKRRVIRLIRNIGISIVALLLLVLGAGVGYTWYMGQDTSTVSVVPVEEPVAATTPVAKRRLPGPDAKASASVQQLTSPVKPGNEVTIQIRSNPTAVCTIAVEYNKIPSTDAALIEKTTDEFGMVDWTWTVDAGAPKGKWPVKVTCSLDEQRSAVVQGDLVVE